MTSHRTTTSNRSAPLGRVDGLAAHLGNTGAARPTLLAVWAHPDDETVVGAGLMAAAATQGFRVVSVAATLGEHGTDDPIATPPERLARIRGQELARALTRLGADRPMLFGYEDMDLAEFQRVLTLNVVGTMLCIKYTLPHMIEAGSGSFIGMSSLAGHVTHPWFGAYPVSKAGIEAMIRNAADENGPHNVRFNAIRPGFVATELMEGIPRDGEVYDSYIRNTPLGDVAQPGDIGQLARFLISPESRWITGQCINVDGGHSLRRGPDFSSFKG